MLHVLEFCYITAYTKVLFWLLLVPTYPITRNLIIQNNIPFCSQCCGQVVAGRCWLWSSEGLAGWVEDGSVKRPVDAHLNSAYMWSLQWGSVRVPGILTWPLSECLKRFRWKQNGFFWPRLRNHLVSPLLHSHGYRQLTKADPDSRGGHIDPASQGEEFQRICRQVLKNVNPTITIIIGHISWMTIMYQIFWWVLYMNSLIYFLSQLNDFFKNSFFGKGNRSWRG